MRIQCGWCRKDMGFKKPMEDPRVSHSICKECENRILNDGPSEKQLQTIRELRPEVADDEDTTDESGGA